MTKQIVGIDPGLSGGIAHLMGETFHRVLPMPIEAKKTKGNRVATAALYEIASSLISLIGPRPIDLVVIEQVSAMPGQGVSGMFSLGDSYGCVRMLGAMLSTRVELVAAVRWKKALSVGSNKGHAITRALQLYPAARDYIKLRKHDGLAEALLLAHYGRLYLS